MRQRGQQGGTVHQAPTIVLYVGDLGAIRPERFGHGDHLRHAGGVGAVDDEVQRERQAGGADAGGGGLLPGERARAVAEPVVLDRVGILEAKLDVIHSCLRERSHRAVVQRDAGGDDVGVEAARGGAGDQRGQVAPGQRFAAGEMDLQDADVGRFVEHAQPDGGVQLAGGTRQLQRVGAVRAGERATMGEFGDQPERRRRTHSRTAPRAERSVSMAVTSARMASAGAS